MSQQVFDNYAPLVKVSDTESIPFAGIDAQKRDDKDEIIVGSVPMVRNSEGTLWVPVDQANPLHTKAKELEDKIDALQDEVEKLTDLISDGRLKTEAEATLTGRKVSRVQPAPLTTTPLGENATYTQSWQDAEAWQGAGGTGALVVSGIAKADKPGTLFLDVSYDGTDFIVWDTALANSTGVARLRPTTIPLRYFRFRYRNGDEAQNSFVLVQNVMQEGDGKGAEYGMGADRFYRIGPMAAGTVELIADLRSAVQIMSIQLTSKTPLAAIRINGYKDDGSVAPVNYATLSAAAALDHRISYVYNFGHSWFEVTRWEDQAAQYVMCTRPGAPLLFPRGVQIYVANNDSAEYDVHCHVYVRLL